MAASPTQMDYDTLKTQYEFIWHAVNTLRTMAVEVRYDILQRNRAQAAGQPIATQDDEDMEVNLRNRFYNSSQGPGCPDVVNSANRLINHYQESIDTFKYQTQADKATIETLINGYMTVAGVIGSLGSADEHETTKLRQCLDFAANLMGHVAPLLAELGTIRMPSDLQDSLADDTNIRLESYGQSEEPSMEAIRNLFHTELKRIRQVVDDLAGRLRKCRKRKLSASNQDCQEQLEESSRTIDNKQHRIAELESQLLGFAPPEQTMEDARRIADLEARLLQVATGYRNASNQTANLMTETLRRVTVPNEPVQTSTSSCSNETPPSDFESAAASLLQVATPPAPPLQPSQPALQSVVAPAAPLAQSSQPASQSAGATLLQAAIPPAPPVQPPQPAVPQPRGRPRMNTCGANGGISAAGWCKSAPARGTLRCWRHPS